MRPKRSSITERNKELELPPGFECWYASLNENNNVIISEGLKSGHLGQIPRAPVSKGSEDIHYMY